MKRDMSCSMVAGALLFFQVTGASPVSDVVIDAPPADGFVEFLSGDGAALSDLGAGALPADLAPDDVHFRSWTRDAMTLVVIASRMETTADLRGFLRGATDAAEESARRVDGFAGLPDVRRFERGSGQTRTDIAVFTKGVYGFNVAVTGAADSSLLEQAVRAQLDRTPADAPREASGDSAYQAGRRVGQVLVWVLVAGLAVWLFRRVRRVRRGPKPPPRTIPVAAPPTEPS